jgi:hypothetical protein
MDYVLRITNMAAGRREIIAGSNRAGKVLVVVKWSHSRRWISGSYFSGSYITEMIAGSICFPQYSYPILSLCSRRSKGVKVVGQQLSNCVSCRHIIHILISKVNAISVQVSSYNNTFLAPKLRIARLENTLNY